MEQASNASLPKIFSMDARMMTQTTLQEQTPIKQKDIKH